MTGHTNSDFQEQLNSFASEEFWFLPLKLVKVVIFANVQLSSITLLVYKPLALNLQAR